MKFLKNYYRKLRMQNKIFITYLMVIMLPMLGFFLPVRMIVTNHSQRESMFSAEQSAEQTRLYVNQKLYNAMKLLNTVLSDKDIYNIINGDYEGVREYTQYQTAIYLEDYFTNIEENNEIEYMCAYMPRSFKFIGGDKIQAFEELKQSEWYRAIVENRNGTLCARESVNGREYITVGRLVTETYNVGKYIGAVKIYIDAGIYRDTVNNCVTTIGGMCYITNSVGDIIAASDAMSDEYRLAAEDVRKIRGNTDWGKMDFESGPAYVQVQTLEYSDWSLVNIIPEKSIKSEGRHLTMIMTGVLLLILLIAYAIAYLLSKTMVSRVVRLNSRMIDSRSGSFAAVEADAPPDTKDEIDMLSESYNGMVRRIEQYAAKQAENSRAIKSAELKVLQEQINPHFLYNVLDLIAWMAMKKEHNKIVEVVRALAEFYKIGLHRGKDMLSIEKEMEYLRFYVVIQRFRYENLQLKFDIPQELYGCVIQKNLLLPLVENSINHGLCEEDEEAEIFISAKDEGDDILFCVRDNGAGISPEVLSRLRAGNYEGRLGGGFGIKNLNERLRLYYGPEHGLTFGDCSDGCVVYVRVKKIFGKSE